MANCLQPTTSHAIPFLVWKTFLFFILYSVMLYYSQQSFAFNYFMALFDGLIYA